MGFPLGVYAHYMRIHSKASSEAAVVFHAGKPFNAAQKVAVLRHRYVTRPMVRGGHSRAGRKSTSFPSPKNQNHFPFLGVVSR
jgi:hypothetical protein